MGRNRLLLLAVLLLSFALLAVAGFRYFAARESIASALNITPQPTPSTNTPASPSPAPIPASTATVSSNQAGTQPPAPALSLGSVQFATPEKIASTSVPDATDKDVATRYEFYRVGRLLDGGYKGADLLLAFVFTDGDPCKGEGCGASVIARYVRQGNTIFALPRISDPHLPDESVGRKGTVDLRPLKALGVTTAQPLDSTIPLLEYPPTLRSGPRAVLQIGEEGVGSPNPSLLKVAFHDPLYGDIWTTKPEAAPQKTFYEECSALPGGSKGAACEDLRTFRDNAFYFFRPDGTYLSYVYQPDFQPEAPQAVIWLAGPPPAGASYSHFTVAGCSWSAADAISVVSPTTLRETDLVPIGKVNASGDALYGLKDQNHPLYKEFYDTYHSSFPNWYRSPEDDQPAKPVSYQAFLNARPLILWKDPFGRFIRFTNQQFIPPQACEPVLYLYPEQTQDVEVTLGPQVAVTKAYPLYRSGWLVSAQPDGELTDGATGRRMPYLFWEGHSYVLPMPTSGFVVKSADVHAFLEDMLPRLGLNASESHDFLKAWAPRFESSPYYLFSFLDRSAIDELFPLRIVPQPDTTIRVLMDFRPLPEPISVPPQRLASPPQRQGFTAVEWGVLVR